MSTAKPTSAKILQHSAGMGVPSSDTVRQRALEIARIDGRADYNERDWLEAQHELHGGHDDLQGSNGTSNMAAMVSEHDMVSSDIGHRVDTGGPEGSESMGEELIAEGMDEAVHEQMLAAARAEPIEEEEDGEN